MKSAKMKDVEFQRLKPAFELSGCVTHEWLEGIGMFTRFVKDRTKPAINTQTFSLEKQARLKFALYNGVTEITGA